MSFLSWIRTPATLRQLATGAAAAQDSITAAFVSAHVRLTPEEVAWGQYIDRPESRQVGLYGAAAGAGALSRDPTRSTIRQEGIHYLLRRYEGRRANATDRYQFELIPKIAGFLRAFSTSDLTNPKISKACLDLIEDLNSSQVPDAGWGYYTNSKSAAISPTCLVILSVSQLGLLSHLRQIRPAIAWLARRISAEYKALHPGELALALHTVRAYQAANPDEHFDSTIKPSHKWLLRQVRLSPTAWHDYLVSYTAVTLKGKTQQENDEYFMMPSLLMILSYLASHRNFDLMRPAVLGQLIKMVRDVNAAKMYISTVNRRASSRENQWALDICAQVQSKLRSSLGTLALYSYVAGLYSLVSRKVLIYAALLFAAIFPAIREDPGLIIGGFVASIIASIVASLMTEGS